LIGLSVIHKKERMFTSPTAYAYTIGFYVALGFYFITGFYLIAAGFYVALQLYLMLGFYLDYSFYDIIYSKKPNKRAPYQLGICEVFHPAFHGQDANSTSGIHAQFLIYTTMGSADFYSDNYLYEVRSLSRYHNATLQLLNGSAEHPSIRNYDVVYNKYMRLEIIQADVLTGNEEVAYLKTFWLRLVQRRWKKIYQARREMLQKRSGIKALQERQRTGQWPIGLRTLPSLHGPSL
jgi:hypothetical protein